MKAPKTFEEGIARLEKLLEQLSDAQTPLADAVKLYSEAAFLIEHCNGILGQAQLQIEELDARLAARQTEGE